MVDHVSLEKRSQIMAAIRGKDTKPEFAVRRLLYAAGYRYRLHVKNLSGKPDIVLRKYKAIIFVHGCFWHGHGCYLSKRLPRTRTGFWKAKILSNKRRDEETVKHLLSEGWRVCTIWDCALKRQGKIDEGKLVKTLSQWIEGKKRRIDVIGLIPPDSQKREGRRRTTKGKKT